MCSGLTLTQDAWSGFTFHWRSARSRQILGWGPRLAACSTDELPEPGCVVKLNFSLAIGPVRGKSWGGLHDWLPVPQRPNHLCFISFCSQSLHLDKWFCGLVAKTLALGPLVSKRSSVQLLPGSFVLLYFLREAPGRQERTHWTACEAPGRQERIDWTACEAPGRHQGDWGPRLAACSADKTLNQDAWSSLTFHWRSARFAANPGVGSTDGCL